MSPPSNRLEVDEFLQRWSSIKVRLCPKITLRVTMEDLGIDESVPQMYRVQEGTNWMIWISAEFSTSFLPLCLGDVVARRFDQPTIYDKLHVVLNKPQNYLNKVFPSR